LGAGHDLIKRLSGGGKTTIAPDLARRDHRVIHVDRLLAFTGDPETGMPLARPPGLDPADRLESQHPDLATLTYSLIPRPAGAFWASPPETRLTARLRKTKEDLPGDAIVIAVAATQARVVDDILARCALIP
jgi:hypothetical protein